jgi:DNA invertase Pin-like site-specific DNA recombinase
MKANQIPVAILVRVSTDEQDNTRQIEELQAVALERGWAVKEVVREDGVSGSARNRPGLAHVLRLAESKAISKLLVHEITRLSRHPAVLHDAVERCNEAGVSIYWHSQRTETLLPDGERNPAAGMMLAILGEMGRTEREFLARRIKSGMDAAKRAGRHMGRPAGSGMSKKALLVKHGDVVKLLRAGHSIRNAAKITGKSKGTVETVKAAIGGPAAGWERRKGKVRVTKGGNSDVDDLLCAPDGPEGD